MGSLIPSYCLSLLLLTSIATSAGSNETNVEEPREPRVSGRIVKLYSGAKPEPYLCTGEGFQADPSNCASFYRCVKERSGKFTVFKYQCAPGTVFDPDVETCNHPRSTRRTECGGMLKPAAEQHHTTNINEIDGAQSEVPRPISTKLPIYAEQTTIKNPTTLSWILSTERQNPTKTPWISTKYSSPSTLSSSIIKPTDSTTNNQWLYSTQHQWESQYTSMSPPKTTQSSNSKNMEPCTSDGFMGDSENCRKFYRCVGNQKGGYIKYEFSCSDLTVWDDEIQGCNHPWAVKRSKCGRSLSYDDKSVSQKQEPSSTEQSTTKQFEEFGNKSNKTIQQQLQVSHGSKVTQTQTQISNSADVIQNQTQINYGDRVQNQTNTNYKQNQTQISYGTAVSQTQTQIDYGNKGMQTQLQIDHSKDSSQSQVQVVDAAPTQSTKSTPANNNSKNECSETGFMGDANDCKKFYRCVNNGRGYTKYEYSCGDGTVWDPEIEACNHAWAVKECGAKHLGVGSTTEIYTTTTTTAKSTEYHTKTTPSYTTSQAPDIEDEDDVGYDNQNNQGLAPSSTTTIKTTTTTAKSTTRKPNGTGTDCTTSGFMGDANDCKVFYRCVDNGNSGFIKYEFKCGDGTVWDPDIEACNHAWAVKNCGGSTSSTTTSSADKEETTTKKENSTPSDNVHTTVTLIQITTPAPTQDNDFDTGYGSQNQEPYTTTTSSTPTKPAISQEQDSNINNICKSSGFMGDKNDCKKFYRCVDNGNGGYIKYEFTCGQGTVWDTKIDACNHAWAVENCGGSNNINESNNLESTTQSSSTTNSDDASSIHTTQVSKETDRPTMTTSTTSSSTANTGVNNKCSSSGFMGDSTDCKKFYRCVDNGDGKYTRYEFTCGEGTVWDPEIEACNHAWAVKKCGGTSGDSASTHYEPQQTTSQHPVIHDEEQGNGYATPNYDTSDISQSTVITTSPSSTTAPTSDDTNHCTNSGFMGDKNNCKKFYRCVDNGKGGYDRYEFQCGEGTVWDGSIEACNHAWAVKECGKSGSSTTHSQNEGTTLASSSSNAYEDGQTHQSTEKTTTTTEMHHELEPTTGDQCTQEGFYGNKYDCKKFYRCVDNGKGGFTKYEFTCGEGTSWDQDIQGCDHTRPDRACASSNTSQIITTQPPSHLNDDMDVQFSSTSKTTTIPEGNENASIQTTKTPQGSHGTCSSEGFYANPSDCKKFYRCVVNGNGGYTKYDFSCGDGTVWNQEIQACDHESSEKSCSGSSSPHTQATESQSESTTSSSTTTKKEETTHKTETSESMGSQCTSEGFFAHPKDCKKFVRCVDNGNGGYTRYEFSCGDGTVWVQEIQACDHDNDVNSCAAQVGPTTQTFSTENNPSSTSTTSSSLTSSTESIHLNEEYDTQTSNEPSHDETDDCTSEGYFANKQDCRKFYRCVDNGKGGYTKYDFVCGDGTAWDSDLQTCNHISEVQSCSGSASEGNGNHQTTTSKNQAESESTSTLSTTKGTTSSESSSNSNNQDTCKSEGYFGNSKDCKKFYRCVDNGKGGYTKYDYSCGEGTIWDQDITTCNHPQDVSNPSCSSSQGGSDASSSSSSTTSSSETTSSTTVGSSSSQSTSDCSQESSKKPGNNNVTCDKAGYYANPNDCKKFYRCVDWDGDGKRFSVFHFECGEGTIWDPALDTCNHEDSVYPQRDCSQTQSQNVGGDTTTTEGSTTTTIESTTSEQTTQESTTAQQTTSETTTTEQSNEPTTTQQATTSDKTTTQESTTTEQTNTTQQPTTSEQTTTQQSTTSEQTTTRETTTSEQTTTQQPTTSEQTTTQQSTTSELTTTRETTTTEQTTTQQPTTSEQTTTQQSTTSEQTTTQQSITSEQTTTEQTTTSERTTTQQSATSESTTTQQTTTSEQTTTQQPTTEQTTTEQTTTEQTTTQESTTNESTTQESSTTEQTTTQESTTTDQTTTQESTTSEQTSTQSTTSEQTTTQQSTTGEPTTTEQSTTTTEQTTDGTTTADSSTDGTTTEETTDQSTTQMSSTESDSTENSYSTTEEYSDKECPETENDQYLLVCPTSFRRHPKYCNMFYQCTEDDDTYEAKVAMFKCPNNTIYDENQTQCVTEDKTDKKCDGEIANKRRFKRLGANYKELIEADKGKQSCSGTGYFPFEKHSECAKGFLKCDKIKSGELRGYVYQCPDGYVYWSISKRCERIESVRDCKRSTNDWTGRWNIPVERKNVANS